MRLPPSVYQQQPGSSGRRPRYFVGIDGGGTGTRAVVVEIGGQALARGEAGPSALGQGVAQAWASIRAAAGVDLADCALGLGLSGAGIGRRAADFLAAAPPHAGLALISDGLAAVLGAHGGAPGAVLIAGTGSVGEALTEAGEHRQVGGWGWQLGDEGSGAWLGRQALRHAHAALDGRDAAGPLARAVWAQAGDAREPLLAWSLAAGQAQVASLAPLVFEHEASDPTAAELLAQALNELTRLAAALDPEARLPLTLGGSIALRLAPRFSAALQARLTAPQGDAASGALRLIQHLCP